MALASKGFSGGSPGGSGGKGGDCDCGKGGMPDCIRLCDTPTPSIPTPNTVPNTFPIPIPITDPTTTPNGTPGFPNWWNNVPGPFNQNPQGQTTSWWNNVPGPFQNIPTIPMSTITPNKEQNEFFGPARPAGLGETAPTAENTKQEWIDVEAASAAAAIAAAGAAAYWDDILATLGQAASKLQAFASSIPNSYAPGLGHFGSPTTMAGVGINTRIATMAESVE